VRSFAALLVACILLLPLAATAQEFDSSAEQQLFELLNQERARAGLPALKWDERLQRAAREHTARMVAARQLTHDAPGEPALPRRLAAAGLRFNSDGENVAYNSSVEGAHRGLMRSPPHRANILSPDFNAGGIGVERAGDLVWVTQDFVHRLENYSETDARNLAIAAFEKRRAAANNRPARVADVPRLRGLACEMAKRDKLDPGSALGFEGVRSAVTYTESDPRSLPASAQKMAGDPTVRSFAVGVCFAESPRYPVGTYWVVMTFY
jgi:uncharacterized protein YkwD